MMSLTFAVHRKAPLLVGPAAPTPRETKRLSDLDDQEILRGQVPLVFFYRGGGRGACHCRADDDLAGVIRRALGEALVPYYPLAGRLREVEERKLVVDCTGEGVLFVEADADVRLAELEAAAGQMMMRPPFPCMDQLLCDVQGSGGVLHCPLLLVQVNRLLCGGFVLALRFNHTVCDGIGIAQFISAVAELARGLPVVTVEAVWCRDLLEARRPPKPTFPHHEYDAMPMPPPPIAGESTTVMRIFTFGRDDILAIKKGLPPHLRNKATSFEVLIGAVWRARAAALELPPDDEARLAVFVNIRSLLLPRLAAAALPATAGYYGNACVTPAVATTAGALVSGSLGDAVELVRAAKAAATAEYVRSALDALVVRGRPRLTTQANTFVVTDVRHAGLHRIDFGWGEPVYGGLADTAPFGISSLVSLKNGHGEDAMGLFVVLPQPAMDRFASELQILLMKG